MNSEKVNIYAHLVSQPSRAVIWLCLLNHIPIDFHRVIALKGDTKTDEFLQINPNGLIPAMKDGTFSLYESHAIMIYLCEKFNLLQWYPKELTIRSKIHQYMNWHHHFTRKSSLVFMGYIQNQLGIIKPRTQNAFENREVFLDKIISTIENTMLAESGFLFSQTAPTLADLSCYCELDQLELLHFINFDKYPKLYVWMSRMKALPYYTESHADLNHFLMKIDSAKQFSDLLDAMEAPQSKL